MSAERNMNVGQNKLKKLSEREGPGHDDMANEVPENWGASSVPDASIGRNGKGVPPAFLK
jgi:hypothetical protein